ncbi:MAG: hypothetical protein OHK0053_12070 [Microscillaceae bacterium]
MAKKKTGKFEYPPLGFHFSVRLVDQLSSSGTSPKPEGQSKEAGFQEVTGLSADYQTEEIAEGGENRFVHKVPKGVRYPNLVLKRGAVIKTSPLVKWCEETIHQTVFPIKPKIVVISLLNQQHKVMMAWNVLQAYPVKYEVSGFNAESTQLLVESIELVYRRFERAKLDR